MLLLASCLFCVAQPLFRLHKAKVSFSSLLPLFIHLAPDFVLNGNDPIPMVVRRLQLPENYDADSDCSEYIHNKGSGGDDDNDEELIQEGEPLSTLKGCSSGRDATSFNRTEETGSTRTAATTKKKHRRASETAYLIDGGVYSANDDFEDDESPTKRRSRQRRPSSSSTPSSSLPSAVKAVVKISKPHHHDVLMGRGRGLSSHPGNVTFRRFVREKREQYMSSWK